MIFPSCDIAGIAFVVVNIANIACNVFDIVRIAHILM